VIVRLDRIALIAFARLFRTGAVPFYRYEAANPGGFNQTRSRPMRISSLLQTATLALSMMAATSAMTAAFAASASAAQQQAVNTSPYDSPDFVVPGSDIQ
jgi:L-alanine-DL-glutamate epimerase-like enolase superfamily enzyme